MNSTELNLEAITTSELPAEAAFNFWWRSGVYTREAKLTPVDFTELYRLPEESGLVTYCTSHVKRIHSNGEYEQCSYFVDLFDDQQLVGIGEMRYIQTIDTPYFSGKPLVGMTRTEDEFQRRGLGVRRLRVMNHLAQMLHGFNLNSDTIITDEAMGVWRKLIELGLAEAYTEYDTSIEDGLNRFRLVS
ncbi:hypothetical protein KC973_03805 [Candidatus Saccharibacteria bacterium]|nr:hypothetical protein [Candidatus Saccharibacteria bacterium]